MTGREQKVYYSYSQISHKHGVPDDGLPPQAQPPPLPGKEARAPGFALPELEHNLQLLIELTEQEIIRNDRQLQYERDVVVNLTHELEKAAGALQQEQRAIASLSEVLALVEECERRLQPGCSDPLTLDECARVFQTLRDKYYEEYRMSDRVDLAVAIVYPLMKDYFKEWDPLKVSGQGDRRAASRLGGPGSRRSGGRGAAGCAQPLCLPPQDCTYGIETISQWKSLLENDQLLSHGGQDLSADAFHRCFWGRRRSAPGRAAGLGPLGTCRRCSGNRLAHLSAPGSDGGALPAGRQGSACVGPGGPVGAAQGTWIRPPAHPLLVCAEDLPVLAGLTWE